MTKLNSLISLLKLNKDSEDGSGLQILCGVISCATISCHNCPLSTSENMDILISELEAKNG